MATSLGRLWLVWQWEVGFVAKEGGGRVNGGRYSFAPRLLPWFQAEEIGGIKLMPSARGEGERGGRGNDGSAYGFEH